MKKNTLPIIGIDASNINQGGGVTHLSELLKYANPKLMGISKIILWSSSKTLNQLPEKSWLIKKNNFMIEGNFLFRVLWQIFILGFLLHKYNCNVLFIPGGSFMINFRPIITMNQNLHPFD